MNILCPNNQPCIDDVNSFGNYSSEEPDRELFRSVVYPGDPWDGDVDIWYACLGRCVSFISQADADLCAHNLGKICELDKLKPNAEATCTKTCPDGNVYSYTIPAGTFMATTQAQADALAAQWCENFLTQLCRSVDPVDPGPPPNPAYPRAPWKPACNDPQVAEAPCPDGGKGSRVPACKVWASNKTAANIAAIAYGESVLLAGVGCLTEFPKSFCRFDDIGTRFVVPDKPGAFVAPFTWDVFGVIPVGLTFEAMGLAMKITGQFMASGDFAFRLTLTDVNGTFAYRNYNVSIMEIDQAAALPDADQDQPYSVTISTKGGVDPKTFAVKTGSTLPAGLSLDPTTGTISGTPTDAGLAGFTILVQDKYETTCEKDFTLVVDPNIFSTIVWNLFHTDTAPGYGYATGAGEHVTVGAVVAGGGAPDGGVADAHTVWNANNTTGDVLHCRLRVVVTGANLVPPSPGGGAIAGPNQLFLRDNTNAIIYANNMGIDVYPGTYDYAFDIPVGITNWSMDFVCDLGAAGPPFPGGFINWEVYLDIL